MIRSFLRRLRFPAVILAVLSLSGCAAVESDWNALTPAQKDKLVGDAVTAAQKLCAKYDGAGGQKNEALETACLGLKVGTAAVEAETPAPSASSNAMPAGSAQ